MFSYTINGDSMNSYSYDNYNPSYNDNRNYQNNYNDYNNNNNYGDKNHGNDNHGNIHTHGKFIAYGNADKGLKYHQITYFHKGKVHSYGKQNIKAKFNIESNLQTKGKYNGKFDQLVGSGNGQYNEGQIPIEYAAASNNPTYNNAPSTYDDNSNSNGNNNNDNNNNNNNNYNDQNNGGSSDDNTYSSGTYNDNYQPSY
ncbi:unnamed protein product [Schistosoma margrebowiei]|uniref:Eggshell protein n=1 Tax=Schistosoma margrebowiei TaxID=48269 RepID=A0AA85A6M7_9TREM|nr:unnamed protein product [Schistosoma margrebowiei]